MYKTSYYDDFKCIGSECPNSCCVGWEIDLDINTFQKYRDLHDSNINKCMSIKFQPIYFKASEYIQKIFYTWVLR